MKLLSSRGFETPPFKFFMRSTVLLADIFFYIPVALIAVYTLYQYKSKITRWNVVFLTLLQPSLLMIDHGHFQYKKNNQKKI